ncbi:MAG: methyltransferase domain-containing protein [Candidatus Omnitrophica bacterium]|nr:methyltransferase domain-containing protein [Candidatus Omnitrophota bacterium]
MEDKIKTTSQISAWKGGFGDNYTDRNKMSLSRLDDLYTRQYGISRSRLNEIFLDGIRRDSSILEVGSNVGNQLALLRKMGFRNLCGVELNSYAAKLAKERMEDTYIIQGSAFTLPFKTAQFDLVFTSGVLIHIAPSDIEKVMREIYRCSRRYIWGFEYYNESYIEVEYRGKDNMLWKADFAKLYLETCDKLSLVKKKRIKYVNQDIEDAMFLLEKPGSNPKTEDIR